MKNPPNLFLLISVGREPTFQLFTCTTLLSASVHLSVQAQCSPIGNSSALVSSLNGIEVEPGGWLQERGLCERGKSREGGQGEEGDTALFSMGTVQLVQRMSKEHSRYSLC